MMRELLKGAQKPVANKLSTIYLLLRFNQACSCTWWAFWYQTAQPLASLHHHLLLSTQHGQGFMVMLVKAKSINIIAVKNHSEVA